MTNEVLRVTITDTEIPPGPPWVRMEITVTSYEDVPIELGWAEIWETFEWFADTVRTTFRNEAVTFGPLFIDPLPPEYVDHVLHRINRTMLLAGLPRIVQHDGSTAIVIRAEDWS